jgi:uncharacterized protein (TIGR02145 family)
MRNEYFRGIITIVNYLGIPLILVLLWAGLVQSQEQISKERRNNQKDSLVFVTGTFDDLRDWRTYKWVQMGEQIWMAENLNHEVYPGNTWCPDDNPTHCSGYGRLYDWDSAKRACPEGWHLPSDREWERMAVFVAEFVNAQIDTVQAYRATNGSWSGVGHAINDTSLCNNESSPATNTTGFSAQMAGGRFEDKAARTAHFSFWGGYAYFWTSTGHFGGQALGRFTMCFNDKLGRTNATRKNGFSVRCVKDDAVQ